MFILKIRMKKFILIIACAVISLTNTACDPKKGVDPRDTDWSIYEDNIISLSKKYGNKKSPDYNEEKSFDLYLTHFFKTSWDIYTRQDCKKEIEYMYLEFDLVYFKQDAKEKLKSYCSYSIKELIDLGDLYAKKTKRFDYNTLNALHFYYNAYIRATHEYLDKDYNHIPSIVELSKESYYKFRDIRDELPKKSYIEVSNDTPFD